MILESAEAETKNEADLQGTVQAEFTSLEVSVKDTKRFPEGWAYYSFGDPAAPDKKAEPFRPGSCWSCHHKRAKTDHVFTQFYPDSAAKAREKVFARLRDPANPGTGADMPDLYPGLDPSNPNPSVEMPFTLTRHQYELMRKWKQGDFDSDWGQALPPDDDPATGAKALDRAPLEPGIGGPFYPGIEVGYIIARPDTYDKSFRISSRLSAGDLTAGNAVPWQADFFECGTRYWPAQRPVRVQLENTTVWKEWVAPGAGKRWMADNWQRLGFITQDGDRFVQREQDPSL